MEPCSRLSTTPIHLRFFGDFEIRANLDTVADFSPLQLILLESILATPHVMLHVARMALETDLNSLTDKHFREKYSGPSDGDLLDCVLPCLPVDERRYWESLRHGPGDTLHNEIMPVFFVFEVRLKKTGTEERST